MTVAKQNFEEWVFTTVYGSPNNHIRMKLWDNLAQFANIDDKPWMAARDFNDIANTSERHGIEIAPEDNRIHRFNDNVNNCGLMDLGALGPRMTWSNRREGFASNSKEGFARLKAWIVLLGMGNSASSSPKLWLQIYLGQPRTIVLCL